MKKTIFPFVAGLLLANQVFASSLVESDLTACYLLEFQHEEITPQVAFDIGQCFSSLASELEEGSPSGVAYESVPGDLTNLNVVLHYAGSWFSRARYEGHPDAEAHMMLTFDQLAD
jgi:hypothetical protein